VQISRAESQIMEALWRRSPLSAEQITGEVALANEWSDGTVKTLINRLLNKGAVSAEPDGRRYLYRPVLSRTDYVGSESRGLLDRLFDGRLAPLVSHLSQEGRLSAEDVAALRRLVQEMEE
jgi:BlaI family penicillinase repressor